MHSHSQKRLNDRKMYTCTDRKRERQNASLNGRLRIDFFGRQGQACSITFVYISVALDHSDEPNTVVELSIRLEQISRRRSKCCITITTYVLVPEYSKWKPL